MSNNKQSSVEWLIAELGEYFPHEIGGIELMVRKAKAMHKEEMINVWIDAYTTNMKRPTRDNFILWAENYYNETYGGNK